MSLRSLFGAPAGRLDRRRVPIGLDRQGHGGLGPGKQVLMPSRRIYHAPHTAVGYCWCNSPLAGGRDLCLPGPPKGQGANAKGNSPILIGLLRSNPRDRRRMGEMTLAGVIAPPVANSPLQAVRRRAGPVVPKARRDPASNTAPEV